MAERDEAWCQGYDRRMSPRSQFTTALSPRRTAAAIAVVTAAAAVTLAGCGGSTASSASSSAAASSAPTAASSAAGSGPASPATTATGPVEQGPTVTANGVTVSGPKGQAPTITVTKGEPVPTAEVKKDVYLGDGKVMKPGGSGTFQYSGVLFSDGSAFDSSWQRGEPISFSLNQVIPGWQQGIPGMKEGGRRLLIVPPALAYGSSNIPGIPPNSTLVFVVDLVKVL